MYYIKTPQGKVGATKLKEAIKFFLTSPHPFNQKEKIKDVNHKTCAILYSPLGDKLPKNTSYYSRCVITLQHKYIIKQTPPFQTILQVDRESGRVLKEI